MAFEITGFEHMHAHTHVSLLDGLATPEEYAERAVRINQKHLCVTDHGSMGVIPSQIRACDENNLSPIFGIEFYYNPWQAELRTKKDREKYSATLSPEEKKRLRKSYHLLAIALNEIGYKNLVRLSSWAFCYGQAGVPIRPRINLEMLEKHKEGIIFTSCCYASEIGYTFDTLGPEAAEDKVVEYISRFGQNFRLEIMMLDFKKQKPYDKFIISMHDKLKIPILLTQDCHYSEAEDSHYQRLMLIMNNKKTIKEIEKLASEGADLFELQDSQLWMKSEEELNLFWEKEYSEIIDYEIFKQAKAETVKVCEMAKGVKLDRTNKFPQLPNASERLKELAIEGFKKRNLHNKPNRIKYLNQLTEELELFSRKGFDSCFLIQKMVVDEARRYAREVLKLGDGSAAIGPGRGSVVGSLACYCLGITDVDPIKHDLLFSRFLSEARGGKTLKTRFVNVDPIPWDEVND